ncbi:hypothetical protein GJ496_003846 [Pomphorhynchus laevis]|nr:hypothetical protein GJ496_003846 [Pomphorhynchus laevis]
MSLNHNTSQNDPYNGSMYGNFHNYYHFNNVKSRMNQIEYMDIKLQSKDHICLLDVGCNIGDLTVSLCIHISNRYHCNVSCLAIDIDSELISKAKLKHSSFQMASDRRVDLDFHQCDISRTDNFNGLVNLWKLKAGTANTKTFDLICLFSVSMWLHIHNGTAGFARILANLCTIGNHFIIEPQSWSSYTKARRRLRKCAADLEFPYDDEVCSRNSQHSSTKELIIHIMRKNGAVLLDQFKFTNWKREILLFVLSN